MPMPDPSGFDSESEWMSHCMGNETMQSEYSDSDQRVAVCMSLWRRRDLPAGSREIRSITREDCELRVLDNDGKPQIVGYAAVFQRRSQTFPGNWQEVIMPGAFDRVLKRSDRDVVALFNHDPNLILGRESSGTLALSVDARGLRYMINPPESRHDVVEMIRRGDVFGSSFAFTLGQNGDSWREDGSQIVREVREVENLYDVGPVVYPAYGDTTASLRKFGEVRTGSELRRKRVAEWMEEGRRLISLK